MRSRPALFREFIAGSQKHCVPQAVSGQWDCLHGKPPSLGSDVGALWRGPGSPCRSSAQLPAAATLTVLS